MQLIIDINLFPFWYRTIWVQSSDPYPISLTLKHLQEMLNEELPMDCNCFNLVVRKMMFHNIQTVKQKRGFVSKHYLDMRFWVSSYIHSISFTMYKLFLFITFVNIYFLISQLITDFGRHPDYRKKLDVEQLANSIRSWPGITYSISTCNSVRKLPCTCSTNYIIYVASNINPISDSYSNKIEQWFYSNHIGQRYKNSLRFGSCSYWRNVQTQSNCKISA